MTARVVHAPTASGASLSDPPGLPVPRPISGAPHRGSGACGVSASGASAPRAVLPRAATPNVSSTSRPSTSATVAPSEGGGGGSLSAAGPLSVAVHGPGAARVLPRRSVQVGRSEAVETYSAQAPTLSGAGAPSGAARGAASGAASSGGGSVGPSATITPQAAPVSGGTRAVLPARKLARVEKAVIEVEALSDNDT